MTDQTPIISDASVDAALHWLIQHATAIGKAKERADLADKMVGHIEALMFKASDAKGSDARKADARSSDRYKEAIIEAAVAAGELAKLYSLRDAAQAKIEAWRTMSSNFRSMKI